MLLASPRVGSTKGEGDDGAQPENVDHGPDGAGDVIAGVLAQPAQAAGRDDRGRDQTVRFATYNASLNRAAAGQLVSDLSTPTNTQARNIAEVLQRVRPDVVLLNEFDYVEDYRRSTCSGRNYLERSQQGARPIRYPYAFTAPSNTGIPTGFDLDRNGTVGGGNDAYGFGEFPGQYGMVVLSRYPIDDDRVRTFQTVPLGRHAGRAAARRPGDRRSRRLVLPRDPRGLPAVQQVALGRPGAGRSQDGARPRLAPDPADLRRSRGPQRHPQPRRDPLLGGLRHPGRRPLHLRRRGPARRAAARVAVRHHGRPERRPAGRRLGGRRRSTSCWTPGGSATRSPPRPARWRRRGCRAAPT